MTLRLTGISSMATRLLLADLAAAWSQRSGIAVAFESVGGVDAAKRVQAGETFDLVVLAGNAIDTLMQAGHLRPGSRVDLVRSGVAVAVKADAPVPLIGDEAALRAAVLAAPNLSYSTGPSGVHLTKVFERWGILDQIRERIVQAPPGVPVGSLVARGDVALGFQQLSELMHLEGIRVVGPLPEGVQTLTTFAGAIGQGSAQAEAAAALLAFMASPEAADTQRRHGMDPA